MSQEVISSKLTTASGVLAAGGSAAPTGVYGALETHGIWLLSYGEWIRVVGVIWLLTLLGKHYIPIISDLFKKAASALRARNEKASKKT